jgi:hypothetical protein
MPHLALILSIKAFTCGGCARKFHPTMRPTTKPITKGNICSPKIGGQRGSRTPTD